MEDEFLKSKQLYVVRKINSIMKSYPRVKYDIKFRNGKQKTFGTVLQDPKTHFVNFVFSNYWIKALFTYELSNLIKHECAHVISDDQHGKKFVEACKKLKCSKKWQVAKPENVDVYSSMLK